MLFAAGEGGGRPLIFVVSLLIVGPLATVIGIQAVSNGLALGIRRGELARGVSRAEAIVGQSAALLTVVGGLLAILLAATLVAGYASAGRWHLGPTGVTLLTGVVAAGAYLGAVQLGAALTRSAAGALLFGLGFLVADWGCIVMLTGSGGNRALVSLARLSVTVNAMSVATGGTTQAAVFGWQWLPPGWAALVLAGYVVVGHALAVAIARRRDA
jgi:ABC-type transport system involved in multi-copper enzyme maturation permease subunit